MNRRNFFKLIAGACALPVVVLLPKITHHTVGRLPSIATWPKNGTAVFEPNGEITWHIAKFEWIELI